MRRLRSLSEAECYARCYGGHDEAVRIVQVARPLRSPTVRLSGERLRRLFEDRLDAREAEEAAA
jgi:hypothetical protein